MVIAVIVGWLGFALGFVLRWWLYSHGLWIAASFRSNRKGHRHG
jgi:hypothetical protein